MSGWTIEANASISEDLRKLFSSYGVDGVDIVYGDNLVSLNDEDSRSAVLTVAFIGTPLSDYINRGSGALRNSLKKDIETIILPYGLKFRHHDKWFISFYV